MISLKEAVRNPIPDDSTPEPSPAFIVKGARQIKENQTVLEDINLEIASESITALIGRGRIRSFYFWKMP
jgi:hypothetical protein